jgi:exosortase family protein XrtF
MTIWVGKAVSYIFSLIGVNAQTLPLENEAGLKLLINGEYMARIIEGCTAVSVIILFVAFVVSFGSSIKKSLLFAVAGSIIIFVFNWFRIVFLGYLLYLFPQWQDIAHRVVFPALIYGLVVLMWMYFVKKININE